MIDPIGERTIVDLLDEQVEARGDHVFLVFEDAQGAVSELTYAAFRERVEACARGLAGAGVGQGDFVVLHLRNAPEFLFCWFGMARLGAVLVPSNIANTAGELEHLIGFSEARLVVTEPFPPEAPASLPLDDTWADQGAPARPGWYVFLPAVPPEGAAAELEAALRSALSVERGWAWSAYDGGADARLRGAVGLPARDGLLVQQVVDDGPAGTAGIKQGDLLVRAGDNDLRTLDDLFSVLRAVEPEGQVAFTVVRGVEELAVTVAF